MVFTRYDERWLLNRMEYYDLDVTTIQNSKDLEEKLRIKSKLKDKNRSQTAPMRRKMVEIYNRTIAPLQKRIDRQKKL